MALAYLVMERHRPVARDELAGVLWGDELPQTWEASLRAVLSRVRASLSSVGLPPGETLIACSGCYRLNLPPDTLVELEEAAAMVAMAETALDEGRPADAVSAATRAVETGAGGFLPGDHGRWVERRQAELAEIRVRALEALAAGSTAGGDHARAVTAAEEAVELAPLRESPTCG